MIIISQTGDHQTAAVFWLLVKNKERVPWAGGCQHGVGALLPRGTRENALLRPAPLPDEVGGDLGVPVETELVVVVAVAELHERTADAAHGDDGRGLYPGATDAQHMEGLHPGDVAEVSQAVVVAVAAEILDVPETRRGRREEGGAENVVDAQLIGDEVEAVVGRNIAPRRFEHPHLLFVVFGGTPVHRKPPLGGRRAT